MPMESAITCLVAMWRMASLSDTLSSSLDPILDKIWPPKRFTPSVTNNRVYHPRRHSNRVYYSTNRDFNTYSTLLSYHTSTIYVLQLKPAHHATLTVRHHYTIHHYLRTTNNSQHIM
jgi:hypothetical protein